MEVIQSLSPVRNRSKQMNDQTDVFFKTLKLLHILAVRYDSLLDV